MAFMMPVMKNDWDIYNSRSRKTSEGEKVGPGRVRKVSECRSESPALGPRPALSPHRSAPAMRSLSYCRAAAAAAAGPQRASRASLRVDSPSKGSASPPGPPQPSRDDKFHTRARASPERSRSRCAACMPYL